MDCRAWTDGWQFTETCSVRSTNERLCLHHVSFLKSSPLCDKTTQLICTDSVRKDPLVVLVFFSESTRCISSTFNAWRRLKSERWRVIQPETIDVPFGRRQNDFTRSTDICPKAAQLMRLSMHHAADVTSLCDVSTSTRRMDRVMIGRRADRPWLSYDYLITLRLAGSDCSLWWCRTLRI